MLRQLTISEAIWIGALCVFAIGTAHAANPVATGRKNEYKVAVKNADADYKAAKEACKSRSGNDRDVCLKQAKADHVKATSEAKARLESKSAMADAREDTVDAQYKVAKEKCDALSGEDNRLMPSATTRSASMSRPESVSSRIASRGSRSAICNISLRFFSPPENPSFTERAMKLASISTIFARSFRRSLNSSGSSSS